MQRVVQKEASIQQQYKNQTMISAGQLQQGHSTLLPLLVTTTHIQNKDW